MLIHKNFESKVPRTGEYDQIDLDLISIAEFTPTKVQRNIDDLKFHDALENTLAMIREVNKYLEKRAPWKLIKEDNSQGSVAATTLAVAIDVLRIGSQLLNPVMPERTNVILTILGAQDIPLKNTNIGELKAGTPLGEGKSPFPRIDTK